METTSTPHDKKARLRSLVERLPRPVPLPSVQPRSHLRELEPASFAQEGLWFVWQMEGPNPAYNAPVIVRFDGAVDVDALNRAIATIVRRHDSLRTRLVERGGVPYQVVGTDATVCLEPRPVAVGRDADELYLREARRPFATGDASLFRAALFQESAERFVLVAAMHHCVSDAWSVALFLRELRILYTAYRTGRELTLGAPRVTYVDYVHWQRAWLGGPEMERQLAYWRRQLQDLPPQPPLLPDRPYPARPSIAGSSVTFAVPASIRERLTALSSEHRCSLYVTLVSALALVLHRCSSQQDLAIGTGISIRRTPDLEELIGFFVNTLVLRVHVSPEASFASLLTTVRGVVLEGFAHQDAPYHRVVEEVRPQRRAAASSLFQVMFTMQNVPSDRFDAAPFSSVEIPSSEAAKFDLSISVQEQPDGLHGQIEYRTDVFEEGTVRRLAGCYLRVLEQVATDPEVAVGRCSLLTENERSVLLDEWSGRRRIATTGRSIHRIFEERVRLAPTATAVVHGDRSLTYGELNVRANQRARRLQALGVEAGRLVGVCLERDLELVITLLAILKVGGAYVPLASDDPVERLHTLLRDAGVTALIVSNATIHVVPPDLRCVLVVDSPADGAATAASDAENFPRADAGEDALAYVMFTSGSTGRPKGVAVPHRAVTRLVIGAQWIELNADTVTLQHSPASFDASTFEVWAPLLNGGRVVLAEGDSADVAGLAEQSTRHGVNTLFLSTGVFLLWAGRPESRAVRLRYLLTGGEVVPEHQVRAIYADNPDIVVMNVYGPTENTTFSTFFPVPRTPVAASTLPIGRPITGSSAYVLDEYRQLQPIGCVGELYVGGAGVADGYLNQPELTGRSFVANPFSSDPRDRLYRTGDRVRWLASGDLEFIGRVDNQVKIRSHRVELEEIEFRLMQLPQVELAVVTARDDPGSGKRLVAYVVPAEGVADVPAPATAGERTRWVGRCRAMLRQALPDYMVPSVFVCCATLPLTPNGKIDRRRLPDPGEQDLERQPYRPPRDEIEHALCEIFQEVLRVRRVGIDDSFFDLGGHSLLATQVAARVRDRLNRRLPLDRLFQHPTIAELARYVTREGSGDPVESLPAIGADEANRYEPFPMTGVQQAYWLGRSGAFELGNISTHAYREIELDDIDLDRLERAWNALIRRHDMLRAVFSTDATQRVLPEVNWYPIACEDLRRHSDQERVQRLAQIRDEISHQMFPATTWPLFEVRATRLTERRVRLHFSMDALPADAMSAMILVRELDRLYQDPSAPLPPLTISFRDYVRGLEQATATPLYQRARAYWEQRAPHLPPAPDLPLAMDPAAVARPRFGRRYHVFDPTAWTRLQERARETGVTPSVLLASVFSRVLGRWSRSRHFTLNLTLFNRLPVHQDVDAIMGDFTSLVPLEIDGRARKPLAEFARDVQSRLWSDMEHRYFDGIEVMRLLNRRSGGGKPSLLPVVFTSTLGLSAVEEAERFGALASAMTDVSAEGTFGITQTPQVWLDNVVSEAGGRLTVTWDAVEELFPAGVLDDMFRAYGSLLDGLAAGTLHPWDACDPPLPSEQARRRRQVNATDADVPEGLLQGPFVGQARHRPSAPAVIQGDVVITYGELDRHARALARALRARSVTRTELVAVVMSKGWEQVAGVLGILYAGAAYLPIDAGLPPDRIEMLLAQGQVRLAVTQHELAPGIAWPSGIEVIAIDPHDGHSSIEEAPSPFPAQPDDLAYVIFTSGSTGVPKGVMIDHRGALNTIVDVNRRFAVGPGDRVLGLSSLSFDLSVYDIFGVLGAGGVLVLPDRDREKDELHWMELVERHGITIWNTVPVLAQLLVDGVTRAGRADAVRSLRLVLMSGDWIPLPLPDRLRACCPGALLVSLGGATEASIWSIAHVIDRVDASWASIPYGRPLANQRLHVLADDLAPCPDWVQGGLFISGVGLAKGYWRDEEKTRQRFLEHPVTGERLYATGDLGRYWPDGTIEFLGREDTQVKVHGHRIELGEIEAVLSQHERVAAAAVTTAGDGADRRLIAYVVPSVAPAGAITDSVQRAAFKLAQPGLRRFSAEPDAVVLERVTAAGPGAAAVRLVFGDCVRRSGGVDAWEPGTSVIGQQRWGGWLSCLAQIPVDGHPLPKRYYPSAGSLYPVQTYVCVREDAVEGIPAGCYYYDPVSHRLLRLNGLPDALRPAAACTICLVAAKGAIEPLYGRLAQRLCQLEAGHMIGLLAAAAPAERIAFGAADAADTETLRAALCLTDDCEVLAWCAAGPAAHHAAREGIPVRALERQSYREFLGDAFEVGSLIDLLTATPDEGPTVYVHIRQSTPAHGAGLYVFDRLERRLVRRADAGEQAIERAHVAENRAIYQRSAFSLYLVGRTSDPNDVIAAGCLGQALVSQAPRHQLGLCPIGDLSFEGIRSRLNLDCACDLLYAMVGGPIAPEQTHRWPLDASMSSSDAVNELRQFLAARLPSYMVPSAFVALERLPLNRNGKVDRRALPAVHTLPVPTFGYEPPHSDTERAIAAMWAGTLQVDRVGVRDSFFELGGNSLSAIRIVSAIRDAFPEDGAAVSLDAFFSEPTVAGIATLIDLRRNARVLDSAALGATLDGPVEEGVI